MLHLTLSIYIIKYYIEHLQHKILHRTLHFYTLKSYIAIPHGKSYILNCKFFHCTSALENITSHIYIVKYHTVHRKYTWAYLHLKILHLILHIWIGKSCIAHIHWKILYLISHLVIIGNVIVKGW